jgi:hypothetical protein
MIVPLGLAPARAPVSWQPRASPLLAASAVLLLLLGALRRLSVEPAADLTAPTARSFWMPSLERPASSTAGLETRSAAGPTSNARYATPSLRSVDAARLAAGEALAAWVSSLQNKTAAAGTGDRASLLSADGDPLHYVWDARPATEGTETTSTCERVNEYGHCLLRTHDVGQPLSRLEAAPTAVNVQLAPYCTQDYIDMWAANEVSFCQCGALGVMHHLATSFLALSGRFFSVP